MINQLLSTYDVSHTWTISNLREKVAMHGFRFFDQLPVKIARTTINPRYIHLVKSSNFARSQQQRTCSKTFNVKGWIRLQINSSSSPWSRNRHGYVKPFDSKFVMEKYQSTPTLTTQLHAQRQEVDIRNWKWTNSLKFVQVVYLALSTTQLQILESSAD